ncbi:MAG: fumarylacetoacetase [Acidimicrobiales bacterium]
MSEQTRGFGIDNLPYGVDENGHVVVAFESGVIDVAAIDGLSVPRDVFMSGSLNAFMTLGPDAWQRTRAEIASVLARKPSEALVPIEEVVLVLPFEVADYVDFYASEEHATAMGRLLRPGSDPLPPAWKYLPIGYHGRSSTVIVSGSPIYRPSGLVRTDAEPAFAPSARLDVEVELGFVVGVGSARGTRITPDRAKDHVFGVVLVNDWSARDIQAFEYQPLGPFLGKSFATSISPWVVPLAALERYAADGPRQQPPPASCLSTAEPRNLAISFELVLNGTVISSMSAAGLYWSMAQQLAHLSANGAATRTGDLFASGTISGREPQSAGSLMELTNGGREPVKLEDGSMRTWIEDGDEVVIRGWCGDRRGAHVDLGEVHGRVVASG